MALAGGAVVTICDAPDLGGVTWGADSTIHFSSNGKLYRVASAGGKPELLAAPDSIRHEYFSAPAPLPDGRVVLFRVWNDSAHGLAALSIRDRRITRLAVTGDSPHYVEGGLIVFAGTGNTVFGVPFDPARLRLTGAPQPITERIATSDYGVPRFTVSSGGTIAFQPGVARNRRELVLVDRAGHAKALPIARDYYWFPRFSPEGSRIVVGIEGRDDFVGDISIYTLDTRTAIRLTSDSVNAQPEWTPDGRSIMYVHGRAVTSLYRVLADGSAAPKPVLARPNSIYESRLTPDGRTLVFREDAGSANRDIWMAPLDSLNAARPLLHSNFDERSIALSPDGRWLAYVSNETGTDEVYIRHLQETSARWRVTTHGGYEPRWARTGELFFRLGDSVYVSRVELGAEARASAPRALFAGRYERSNYEALWDVSPDASQFVMVRSQESEGSPRVMLLLNWTLTCW